MLDIKSWKTTIIGVILLAGAIILFLNDRPLEASICLTNSIGMFVAKDSTVTGVGSAAKTEHEIDKAIQTKNYLKGDE